MTVQMKTFSSREEWLQARKNYLGGSDAAAAIGKSPWKDNVTLWMEKTGQATAEDISGKPYVRYGTVAEAHLRELFKLDFPEYEVLYEENNMWTNDKFPWAHYSADGWLLQRCTAYDGTELLRRGLLEIKTTVIQSAAHYREWKDRIPDTYYCQLLHGLMVTEFDFAVLKAQLKFEHNGDIELKTKHYLLEAPGAKASIEQLATGERAFWRHVQSRQRPTQILPEI